MTKKHLNLNIGKGHEQMFSQRRHANGQQEYENVFNIPNHQGNANQDHNDTSLYTCQDGRNQNDKR